jgi:hypothetical protein
VIELQDGFYFDVEGGTIVKSVGENQCSLYPRGVSSMDGGFLIDRPALEVATDIAEELESMEDTGDQEE